MRAVPGRRVAVTIATTVAAGAFAGAAHAAPSITVSKPADLLLAGDSVVVKGKGFEPGTTAAPRGVYVALTGADYDPTNRAAANGGAIWQRTIQPDGTFTVTLPLRGTFGSGASAVDCGAQACGVRTFADHRNIAVRDQDVYRPVNFRSAASVAAASGSVAWGVKQSFRRYIVGNIARGTITVEGGVTQSAPQAGDPAGSGPFTFPYASGSVDPGTGRAYVQTAGAVHFKGHGGQLDLRISDVRVLADGADRRVIADVVSKSLSSGTTETYEDVDLSSLDAAAQPTTSLTSSSWTAVPTKLTATGAPAFAGFYSEGTETDPVTFSASTEAAQPTSPTDPTPAQPTQPVATTPAATTPPAAAVAATAPAATTAAASKPATTKASPKVTKSSLSPKRLRFRVSAGSTVTARVQRRISRKVRRNGRTRTVRSWSTVRTLETTRRTAGWISLDPKVTKAGTYRITVRATSADGVEGKALVFTKRVTQAAIRKARKG